MKWGCEQLKPVIKFIKEIQAEIGQQKEAVPALADDVVGADDKRGRSASDRASILPRMLNQ